MTLGQTTEIAMLVGLALAAAAVRHQGDADPGDRRLVARGSSAWRCGRRSGSPWPGPCCTASASPASRSGRRSSSTAGHPAICGPAPRPCSWWRPRGWARSSATCWPARSRPGPDPSDVLVFLIPCMIDGALLLYFLRGFRVPASGVPWAGAPDDERPLAGPPSGRGPVARVGHLVTESADG